MAQQPVSTATPKGANGKSAGNGSPDELDPFYILATSPQADEATRVLKQGDTFAVFDHYGDIKPSGLGEEGLYHGGTRFLSSSVLMLGKDRPLFLSSTVKQDNDLFAIDLTNPDVYAGDRLVVPRGTLHVFRSKFLWQGVCYERVRLKNYGTAPVEVSFFLRVEADFADIFEVRGTRGRAAAAWWAGGSIQPASWCWPMRGSTRWSAAPVCASRPSRPACVVTMCVSTWRYRRKRRRRYTGASPVRQTRRARAFSATTRLSRPAPRHWRPSGPAPARSTPRAIRSTTGWLERR